MMNVVGIDTEHERDDGMARQMLHDLVQSYPGHDWHVLIRGGVVQVKIVDINPHWGMVLHYNAIKSDAMERKRDLLRSAGEFLERARLKRGAKQDVAPTVAVEGIPDKYMAAARIAAKAAG